MKNLSRAVQESIPDGVNYPSVLDAVHGLVQRYKETEKLSFAAGEHGAGYGCIVVIGSQEQLMPILAEVAVRAL